MSGLLNLSDLRLEMFNSLVKLLNSSLTNQFPSVSDTLEGLLGGIQFFLEVNNSLCSSLGDLLFLERLQLSLDVFDCPLMLNKFSLLNVSLSSVDIFYLLSDPSQLMMHLFNVGRLVSNVG